VDSQSCNHDFCGADCQSALRIGTEREVEGNGEGGEHDPRSSGPRLEFLQGFVEIVLVILYPGTEDICHLLHIPQS